MSATALGSEEPEHNRAVAALQRKEVAEIQRWQPRRPVLVQPLRAPDAQKDTRWVPIDALPAGMEIWTRSVGLNEVVFDPDVRPWRTMCAASFDLQEALAVLGVPSLTGFSGGKGAHTHVLLSGVSLDEDLFNLAKRYKVDAWRVARVVVANALLDAAEVADPDDLERLRPSGRDNARWAAPHGRGVFDRSKVSWRSDRAGSMLRAFGCRGANGFRKTMAPPYDEWDLTAPPVDAPLRFPRFPWAAWEVPPAINARIGEAVAHQVALAKNAAHKEDVPSVAPGKTLRDVPCVFRFLREGAPAGSRHFAFLNLVVTCKALGYSRVSADRFVLRALRSCGLPDSDPAREIVDEVYSGRYHVGALGCPSPHTNLCDARSTRCAFSRRVSVGRKRS